MREENIIKHVWSDETAEEIQKTREMGERLLETCRRQIVRLFRIDAALLGDPFGEPSYVTAERIRHRSMLELRGRMEAMNVTEEQAAEEAPTQGSSEESKG